MRPSQKFRFGTSFLLVLCAFLSFLVTQVSNSPELTFSQFIPIIIFGAALVAIHLTLWLARYSGDPALVGAIMTLCGLGIIMQTRIGSLRFESIAEAAPAQLAFPIGVLAMLATYLAMRGRRYMILKKAGVICLGASCAVIAAVLILGRSFRGAVFLPGNVNPVEIVKPLLIIFLAGALSSRAKDLSRRWLIVPLPRPLPIAAMLALWAVPMALLVLQRDIGLIALMNLVLLVMLYSVTRIPMYLVLGGAAVAIFTKYILPLSDHATERLNAWRDPFIAATGNGWQILQGLVALYSGGIAGKGIGAGSPSIVPIVESDFVYVIFGEELGFVGCGLLLLLYVLIAVRGFGISARKEDEFASSLAAGLTACIVIQALLNIGGVTKAIPLTGITLPFVSHGGSSLVSMLIIAGLLMAISDGARRLAGKQ